MGDKSKISSGDRWVSGRKKKRQSEARKTAAGAVGRQEAGNKGIVVHCCAPTTHHG